MSDDPSGWSLTESDPQVFTQLLKDLGVKGLQVDDVFSLDAASLSELKPIYAFIFLFKYLGGDEAGETAGTPVDPFNAGGVCFANQIINNSCATVAAINAVMNIEPVPSSHPGESVERGDLLDNLRSFAEPMGPEELGHVIASTPEIREAHNSFSQSSPFSIDPSTDPDREKADAYHFVTYVPINGTLFELDGLRPTALSHGACGQDWTERARETIEARIATYPPGSVMFNVLAVRGEALPRLQRQMAEHGEGSDMAAYLQERIQAEVTKVKHGQRENALRKHNILPVIFAMLTAMGKTGALAPAVEHAKRKSIDRRRADFLAKLGPNAPVRMPPWPHGEM